MHEVSLVQSLLEQVDRIVTEQGGRAAVEVRVEIGPLSGVEPLLVKAAFDQLTGRRSHETSVRALTSLATTLIIDEVPLTARCGSCHTEFIVERFRFVCPHCGLRETNVVRGDAFRLMSVTVDVSEGGDVQQALPAELASVESGLCTTSELRYDESRSAKAQNPPTQGRWGFMSCLREDSQS